MPLGTRTVDRYEVFTHGGRWREVWELDREIPGRIVRYERQVDGDVRVLIEARMEILDMSDVRIESIFTTPKVGG